MVAEQQVDLLLPVGLLSHGHPLPAGIVVLGHGAGRTVPLEVVADVSRHRPAPGLDYYLVVSCVSIRCLVSSLLDFSG
jgi:hypothetical protein